MSDPLPTPPEWDRLLSACQKNNVYLVKKLIEEEGVSPSHSNRVGQSALHIASLWGHVECVQVLLNAGANVCSANRITGATPLHCAIQASKASPDKVYQVVQLLVRANPSILSIGDSYGSIAADYCQDGADDKLKALLQPEVPQIFEALKEQNVSEVARLLSTADDAAPVVSTRHLSQTPLLFVVDQLCKEEDADADESAAAVNVQLLNLLLQHGASPNDTTTTDRQGHLVLSTPENGQSPDESRPLHRVCLALKDSYRFDPQKALHLMQAARELQKAGAAPLVSVASSTSTASLLHDAARRNNTELVDFCLDVLQVDVNTPGAQGLTPLHFAARSGQADMVRHLLQKQGIEIDATNDQGKTALDAAKANNKQEIVDSLMEYAAQNK